MNQSTPSYKLLRLILVTYFHPHLGLPSGFMLSGITTKMVYEFYFFSIRYMPLLSHVMSSQITFTEELVYRL